MYNHHLMNPDAAQKRLENHIDAVTGNRQAHQPESFQQESTTVAYIRAFVGKAVDAIVPLTRAIDNNAGTTKAKNKRATQETSFAK